MLKICDSFLKTYIAKPGVKEDEMRIGKKNLYNFFNEYTEKNAKDW
jgi:hypothetical protein